MLSSLLIIVIILSVSGLVIAIILSFSGLIVPSDLILTLAPEEKEPPILKDSALRAEVLVDGLKFPTSIAFLGPDDMLVLEKDNGNVKRIVYGEILKKPLLDVEVANELNRGMLGIAIGNQTEKNTAGETNRYIFLYYTESSGHDGNDDCFTPVSCKEGSDPKGNRLYRYELNDQGVLVNPKLLLDIPATPGAEHHGGILKIGPDNNIYLTGGDGHSCTVVNADSCKESKLNRTILYSQTSNVQNGLPPAERGGILRVNQNGQTVQEGILGKGDPLEKYYAYGIRNSFGMDFDPITGNLWDTENGPSFGDEINLVEPGFNSGWLKIQGIWPIDNSDLLIDGYTPYRGYISTGSENITAATGNLADFHGNGKYSDPEFVWNQSVGVTGLKFLNSTKLGKVYENDMFVGDFQGNIYHFDLNEDRTALSLNGTLKDKVADSSERRGLQDIIFGQGFGIITDIEVGPDGYLYVVSFLQGIQGKIFKIVPRL
ncbi:MAG TPA: PQQ-dependent sugar dehydrogenase [Nitrososphaeraceae archaeon]|jgi:glucose/arabinose dehydrogenase|nr:PQQ-dependent sugar dehydrogenase [Nitrososphaeraceae archaeon]